MDFKGIRDLVKQFDDSSLTELDLRKADFELYLNKNLQPGRKSDFSRKDSVSSVDKESSKVNIETNSPQIQEDVMVSPIVGVVYLQPSPDDSPYVVVGESVEANQTICIIEAMKMMNEIPAGRAGVVTEIFVENEQVVGIGDPLFQIH
ncbi:MAG: acetyl-CoA carboxylase biotin carboxyl carrier protein [Lactobacillales bacterium]|jgi:acetyl-CoA carboxylase biotin carboxyl carrier protein|nr:acetyl-CoA carboxylase biotin carboxyl carrier protein [Lactobacillales bacterium]